MQERSRRKTSTWQPPEDPGQFSGKLDAAQVNSLPDSAFAFPGLRKEPLVSASHVRNSLARFDQVDDASDADRALAFANIREAAAFFGVHMTENSWHDLMKLASPLTAVTQLGWRFALYRPCTLLADVTSACAERVTS
jgi:hypothetical protein